MIAFLVLIGSVTVYGQDHPQHSHSCHPVNPPARVVSNIITNMDKNHDGRVTKGEVKTEFISSFHSAKDGEVSEDDFVEQWHQRYLDFAGYLFHHLDTNDDEKLTRADFPALAKTIDDDENGQVSVEEFRSFTMNLYVNCVPSKYSHGP